MPEFDSRYHRIHVVDNGAVRLMRFERNHQSSMLIEDPYDTDIEYVHYLHLPLAVRPQAERTLVVGLGGGSLVRRMWRDYPWMHIDSVEIDAEVVEVARAYFGLPEDERLSVFVDDGRNFIESSDDTYDIIVMDAFDDDHVPRRLLTEEFLLACRDRLSPDGVLAYNIIGAVYGDKSKPFRSFYRTLATIWKTVFVFIVDFEADRADFTRNLIVLATDVPMTQDDLLERIASGVDGLVSVPRFRLFGEDLYRSKVRSGDVPTLTDGGPARRPQRG